jgi:ribosomal protein S18 acetylase RimI-like enzyme
MNRTPRIVAFEADHLDAAATLVASRQERLREIEPMLPARWCDRPAARSRVEAALADEHASGVAALEDDRLVGFLIGSLRFAEPWGRAGWVDAAGHAVAPDRTDVARDLFAAWAEPHLRWGIFRYLVNVLSAEADALEPWYQLNFGQMHAYAIRSTDASGLAPPPEDVGVRLATEADVAVMGAASEIIWREQLSSPSWSPFLPERVEPNRSEYVALLTPDDETVWVAEDAVTGEALGACLAYPLEPDLDIPDRNLKLTGAGTFETARRRGVSRALVHAVLEHARSQDVPCCVLDWRTSSLLASRAWPALGWRRTRIRLERQIDERIAWADGKW